MGASCCGGGYSRDARCAHEGAYAAEVGAVSEQRELTLLYFVAFLVLIAYGAGKWALQKEKA